MKYSALILSFLISYIISAQIIIDGKFDDWVDVPNGFNVSPSQNDYDLTAIKCTNDNVYLYVQFQFTTEVKLDEGNNFNLFIDFDNDNSTGKPIGIGTGAEFEWNFDSLIGRKYNVLGNSTNINQYGLGMVLLPTVSSEVFEVVIGLDNFSYSDQIRIWAWNGVTNTTFPNDANYVKDIESNIFEFSPTSFEKNDVTHLRFMAYNVLQDGLVDNNRKASFERKIAAIQPDFITFNECWDMTALDAQNFLDETLPNENWYTEKLDYGNIAASKYPITEMWEVVEGRRVSAYLIDLPDAFYPKDVLMLSCHLKCCEDDNIRQSEVDETMAFVKDAKTVGGEIDLPEGTPIVIMGDMNFVGDNNQLITLTEGDIEANFVYGDDFLPDWDDTFFETSTPTLTHLPFAYTWLGGSNFYRGKLDYIIYSGSVLNIEKSFVVDTDQMPTEALNLLNLNGFDSENASDHLPVVVDFSVKELTTSTTKLVGSSISVDIFTNGSFIIHNPNNEMIESVEIYNVEGKMVEEKLIHSNINKYNYIQNPTNQHQLKIIYILLKNGLKFGVKTFY